MNYWLLLILSLPTENASMRMRVWRSLKNSGSAVLRDGVYLLPERPECRDALATIVEQVRTYQGQAELMRIEEPDDNRFIGLFDRQQAFAELLASIHTLHNSAAFETANDALKQARKLRKAFTQLCQVDFFPGEAQRQTEQALNQLDAKLARIQSPDEPHSIEMTITTLNPADFQNQIWATRSRPWVDRLACAWLIRRFIDGNARFLWLASPADCPNNAIGFDFDGARFSHCAGSVTFEVMLASFSLEQPALKRLGALVHFLDVGGVQPLEASGVECVLAGLKANISNDEQLLTAASAIFDSLLSSFSSGEDL
ncbi:chromate resistance protein ChrB domain-containing protein [Methylocucumis oryzae]|uniref:Chromate resistance protein n=1 Tax=Methylocucumis oryzae TaxID=1632867 RepID=A0A0F3IJC0_9GAMM|nr:chromate resistance protein ChrB domain-containing protein [Methylocucumis oryzae]KJV05644.1 chromate resistance protein [Methylocucumis oryzae]